MAQNSSTIRILILGRIDPLQPYGWHIRPYNICKYLTKILNKHKVITVEALPTCYLFSGFRLFKVLKILFLKTLTCKMLVLINSDAMHSVWNFLTKLLCVGLRRRHVLITDLHGVLYDQLRIYSRIKKFNPLLQLVRLLETASWRLSDYLTLCSIELARRLRELYNKYPIAVIYDSYDVEAYDNFKVDHNVVDDIRRNYNLDGKILLVMIAPRSNVANILAIKFSYKVLRIISRHRRDVVLFIIGGGKPITADMPSNVIYTGHLKYNEMFTLLKLATLALAPYPKGAITGGARNKILDYWFAKIPVVATYEGISGFTDVRNGVHYIHGGETPEEFAKTILSILESTHKEYLNMIAEEAHKLLLCKYDWKVQIKKLAYIILKIVLRKIKEY